MAGQHRTLQISHLQRVELAIRQLWEQVAAIPFRHDVRSEVGVPVFFVFFCFAPPSLIQKTEFHPFFQRNVLGIPVHSSTIELHHGAYASRRQYLAAGFPAPLPLPTHAEKRRRTRIVETPFLTLPPQKRR